MLPARSTAAGKVWAAVIEQLNPTDREGVGGTSRFTHNNHTPTTQTQKYWELMKNILNLTELREKGEWLGWTGGVAATSKHRNTNMEYFARPWSLWSRSHIPHNVPCHIYRGYPPVFAFTRLQHSHTGYDVSSLQCSAVSHYNNIQTHNSLKALSCNENWPGAQVIIKAITVS